MSNFKVISKHTSNVAYVTKITTTKIYVDFYKRPEESIGFSLKKFIENFQCEVNELETIILIRKHKQFLRKEELRRLRESSNKNDDSKEVKLIIEPALLTSTQPISLRV